MSKSELHPEYLRQKALQEALLTRKNHKSDWYNGIYDRWEHPVLTREHIPLEWRFDLDPAANPYFMERLGVNAVFNAGAIELDGKFYLVARVEGNDRKSFFAVAESDSPVDGFRFWDKPIELPDTCPEETNVYDMRLTRHEDGWIYGVFCSESKDTSNPDLSAAVAAAGIVRPGRALEGDRRARGLPDRAPWLGTCGRCVQCGVHQRRHRAGQRRSVHLLRRQRHPAARGQHHGGPPAGLCLQHPGRSPAQPRLRGPAVRPH